MRYLRLVVVRPESGKGRIRSGFPRHQGALRSRGGSTPTRTDPGKGEDESLQRVGARSHPERKRGRQCRFLVRVVPVFVHDGCKVERRVFRESSRNCTGPPGTLGGVGGNSTGLISGEAPVTAPEPESLDFRPGREPSTEPVSRVGGVSGSRRGGRPDWGGVDEGEGYWSSRSWVSQRH